MKVCFENIEWLRFVDLVDSVCDTCDQDDTVRTCQRRIQWRCDTCDQFFVVFLKLIYWIKAVINLII